MKSREKERNIRLAKKEIAKKNFETNLTRTLFFITVCSFFIILLYFFAYLSMTGYASYIASRGGYVTELSLTSKFPTLVWHGVYGLALQVPDFSEVLFTDAVSGEIARQDLFFGCIQKDAVGGNEIYAVASPTIDFSHVTPVTPQIIDNYLGCVPSDWQPDCAENTFKENMSIMLGGLNITNIPSTHTFRWDGENNIFDLGILNISGQLGFVTHISSLQKGYNPLTTVNFQMLLPTPANSTIRYYFFTDPTDDCPSSGSIGENINVTVSGYAKDVSGNPIENATITIVGVSNYTDSSGFYHMSLDLPIGTFNLIASKTGYDTALYNLSVNYTHFIIEQNVTLSFATPYRNQTITPHISGYVFDELGIVPDAVVIMGSSQTVSNSTGGYSLYPTILVGNNPLIAYKEGYNNFYTLLNFTNSTTDINYNITLESLRLSDNDFIYPTGPFTKAPTSFTSNAISMAQKNGEDFWVSTKEINIEVRQNTFSEQTVSFYNFQATPLDLVFTLSPELARIVKLDRSSLSVPQDIIGDLGLTFYGNQPLGTYNGTLQIRGGITQEIPITIKIVDRKMPIETLIMDLNLIQRNILPGQDLSYKLNLQNLLSDQNYKIALKSSVIDANGSVVYSSDEEDVEIQNELTLLKDIALPKNLSDGSYTLKIDASYLNLFSSITSPFTISTPLYLYSVFGIPLWTIMLIISVLSFISLNTLLYKKKYIDAKKRYKIPLDLNLLPKPGPRSIKLGKVAETNVYANLELERLTTHTIVAGATGSGKSIAAQVLVEEALLHNVAVIVFDPTAQWSGMLRKCTDKRMMSFYPKFGLKESDSKAFLGNIRSVKNSREKIDINKYVHPGQIQILTLNKLDPSEIDIFVANVIRQIFRSDPQESPDLKVLLVFDEVHRLLAKFGGSGEGFLQIERACREFRKWGIGLLLISQVLSDFVGEIKANINTELQMRTIEESDLDRIKTKYGEEFLKALVKADIGVGMFQNAEYNKGRPYFINFRPILHNTRRLTDEELEKYNKYNEIVEDLEYQLEQLENEKVDTFDLKMELKLVKDKVMTGNFSIVDIYLEGLQPRLEKEWTRIGKKPAKKELELIDESEIKKSIEEAKKSRQEWEKQVKKEEKTEEAKEEKEENLQVKVLKPLTFDNGIMVSNIKELEDALPSINNEIFRVHVNQKKNDIADWISAEISPEEGEKLKNILKRDEMLKALGEVGKKKEEKAEDKEESKEKAEAIPDKKEEKNAG